LFNLRRMRSVGGVAVALEDAAEAAEQLLQTGADPARGTPTPARHGIAGSVVTAGQLLPLVLPNGRTSTPLESKSGEPHRAVPTHRIHNRVTNFR
jgi:hypothetical protein